MVTTYSGTPVSADVPSLTAFPYLSLGFEATEDTPSGKGGRGGGKKVENRVNT